MIDPHAIAAAVRSNASTLLVDSGNPPGHTQSSRPEGRLPDSSGIEAGALRRDTLHLVEAERHGGTNAVTRL